MSLRLAQVAAEEERTRLRLTCTASAAGILGSVRVWLTRTCVLKLTTTYTSLVRCPATSLWLRPLRQPGRLHFGLLAISSPWGGIYENRFFTKFEPSSAATVLA